MSRGIDHLVLAVRDIDGASALYERLGFTLTPRAQHPFGTQNNLVQLQGCFLELLGIADPDLFPIPEPGAFSFPRFNARFLDRYEGASMLVLDSDDAVADGRAFAAAGIQVYAPFEFGRDARLPDGSTARVGFRLAFASDPFIPEAGFFTCQQLAPQYFWKPDYQRHANTARAVTEIVFLAEKPSDHVPFFRGFTGSDDIEASPDRVSVRTARGTIRIKAPDALTQAWGSAIAVEAFPTPRIAGYTVGVSDIAAAGACLDGAAIPHEKRGRRLIVPASASFGAAIAFEEI